MKKSDLQDDFALLAELAELPEDVVKEKRARRRVFLEQLGRAFDRPEQGDRELVETHHAERDRDARGRHDARHRDGGRGRPFRDREEDLGDLAGLFEAQ